MRDENLRFSEIWEKHYFVFVKYGYVLLMAAYLLMNSESANRGNALTLAAAALCACVMAVYETARQKKRRILLLGAEWAAVLLGMKLCGSGFAVLLPVIVSDAVCLLQLPSYLFCCSLIGLVSIDDKFTYLMLCLLTTVIYWQHSAARLI